MSGHDPYAWVDPFAERDRADRAEHRTASAFDEGKRAVLRYIGEDHKGDFSKALGQAVDVLAKKVAAREIEPHMAKSYAEYEHRCKVAELAAESLSLIAAPLLAHVRSDGELVIDIPRLREEPLADMTFTVQTTRPFEYHVGMSPMAWRR